MPAPIALLEDLFGREGHPDLAVRLWDGTRWPDARPRAATLVLASPASLRAMLLGGGEAALAEAYLAGAFDVEGDWEAALDAAWHLAGELRRPRRVVRLAWQLARLPRHRAPATGHAPPRLRGRLHSAARDRAAVAYHYDVSNEFFRLFLGETMTYSCAYFEQDDAPLDVAQTAKLDLVCRKLRLRPGQRLLDIGCGWGSLVMHAAERYGVDATGITLSARQAAHARERIAKAGLDKRVEIQLLDYRELPADGTYDAIASIGMVEHVGAPRLPEYFARAFGALKPRGVLLNHGIAAVGVASSPRRDSFIARHVFPDGELVPIERMLEPAARAGFEVRDVESLREHYARTLRHWVANLERAHEQALAHVSEATYRVWRLYMAGSALSFRRGRVNIYQTLLAKPDASGASGLPATRRDWYA